MIRRTILALGLLTAVSVAMGEAGGTDKILPLQKAEIGQVIRHEVSSPELGETMTVDVWVPEGYEPDGTQRYTVLYMHDGQNLYDATTTWNGQSWEMDRTAGRMIAGEEIEPLIIVGIQSDPERRIAQLMPEDAVAGEALSLLREEKGIQDIGIVGNRYADFVVSTLKPFIDANYRTLTDRDHTAVMGSSMGGLMSLYLICRYPEIFGKAGCLSTHWYGVQTDGGKFGEAMMKFVGDNLPDPGTHRLYFDHGTTTIDAYYGPWEIRALETARKRGYRDGVNLDSFVDEGAPHNEDAWAARVDRPLRFLFGNFR